MCNPTSGSNYTNYQTREWDMSKRAASGHLRHSRRQWYFSQKLGILLIWKVPGSNERAPSLQVLRRVRLSAVHGQVWHPGHVVAQWPAHVDLDGLACGVGTASATPISQGQNRGRDHQDGGHHLARPRGNHCAPAPNPSAGSPSDVWELHFNFSSFFHSSYCCFTLNNFVELFRSAQLPTLRGLNSQLSLFPKETET